MLWPLGQTAYGTWNQRALQTEWRQAAGAPAKVAAAKARSQRTETLGRAHLPTPSQTKPKRLSKKSPHVTRILQWEPLRIVIPEINVDAVVVQGMDSAALRRGPGHDPQSPLPGQPGNCVIAAHRNVFGSWFADLDRLWPGSLIELHTPHETFTYQVLNSVEVFQNDTSVLQSSTHDATPRLTLITCTLPASLYRHVVTAQLISS